MRWPDPVAAGMIRTVQAESGRVKAASGHGVSDSGPMARDASDDEDEGPSFDLELAARFRAAFGYAGMTPANVAKALGVSVRTVNRLNTGYSEITAERVDQTIALTHVPSWFMEHGWEGANLPDEVGLAEEVQALRSQMETVLSILGVRAGGGAGGSVDEPQGPHGDPEDQTGTGR